MKGLEVSFFCQTYKKEEPNKVHLELPKAGITANATTTLLHNAKIRLRFSLYLLKLLLPYLFIFFNCLFN